MSADRTARLAAIGPRGELLLLTLDATGGLASAPLLDPEAAPEPPQERSPASYHWPLWSPGGDAIIVSTTEYPKSGQPPALLLRYSLESGSCQVLHRNSPGTEPMGAGLPHYVNPSPDGQHLLLLGQAAPSGLVLLFLDSRARGPGQPIARGAPLFSAWSPGSDAVLLHVGGELSLMELSTAPASEVLATNHVGYRVPAWSPDGQGIVVAAPQGRKHSLVLHDRRGKVVASLAPSWEAAAFAWSPDGGLIAQARSRRARPQTYGELQLVSPMRGRVKPLGLPDCLAFIWSPNGEHLALLVPGSSDQQAGWIILDRDGTPVRRFPALQLAAEMGTYSTFFDQYALSHPLWSPDGSALLAFGRLPYDSPPPELLRSCIYLHDLRTGQTSALSAGASAFWSPVAR